MLAAEDATMVSDPRVTTCGHWFSRSGDLFVCHYCTEVRDLAGHVLEVQGALW